MTWLSIALGRLTDAPMGPALAAKLTALLGVAWLGHRALTGRNPRWRVALWRGSIAGLALIAALSCGPPLVRWPIAAEARLAVGSPRPGPVAPAPEAPATREAAGIGHNPPRPRLEPAAGPPPMVAGPAVGSIHAPATAVIAATRPAWPLAWWLLAIWAAGVVVLGVRLALASGRLSRIVRDSTEAPGEVIAGCREVAERLGVRRIPAVRLSADLKTPCLAGVRRPVLLLPAGSVAAYGRGDLRAIFAHELAHERGHDLSWNLAAHFAAIGLWFHPLAWRVRRAHAEACDAVCDAVAADLLGDVTVYGRTLARLALGVAQPPPTTGLAMARTSDVRRRVEALHRHVFRTPLPRRFVMAASSLAAALAVLVGGLALTRAEPQAPEPPQSKPEAQAPAQAEPPAGRIEILAIEAATNRPLEGVSISFQGSFDGTPRKGTIATDKEGKALAEWPAASKVGYFRLETSKSKFVPIYKDWSDEVRPVELPRSVELRCQAGTPIGGVVRDEAGQPIAGAKVSISAPVPEKANNFHSWLGFKTTDAEGQWRLDEAPEVLAGLNIRVEHPAYRPGWAQASRNLDSPTVLKKGLSVRGRVVDGWSGKPIAGARAVLGADIWGSDPPRAKSDASGWFTLENGVEGPSVVTIQCHGYAPELKDVRVGEDGEPVEFRLGPSNLLKVRVVDREGKPVAGAYFAADTWRGRRSIHFRATSDAEGRIAWNEAPKDVVLCDLGQGGFMARRHAPLTASGAEQTVTLDPELVLSGRVTDASTGAPVPEFRIVSGRRFEGQEQVFWSRGGGSSYTGGQYTFKTNEASAAHFLRVEAIGYRSADSLEIKSDEGARTIDFALERTEALSGVVLLPDGRPAPGVEVALATVETRINMSHGGFARSDGTPMTRTGPDGRFAFSPPGDRFLLIALGDAGYADASGDLFAKGGGKLALQPWGRIEGRVLIAGKPGADQPVHFEPIRPVQGGGIFVFDYDYSSSTDRDGRFRFDRVMPGAGNIGRVVITEFSGGSQMHASCWQEPIEARPGQTATVTIGGTGRAVIGRVVLDGTPDAPVDWRRNEPATIQAPRSERGEGPRRHDRFVSNLDRDGRFRVEDVPPGRFELTIPVNAQPDPKSCGAGTKLGELVQSITVPEGSGDGPNDLGEVRPTMFATLQVGDLAPGFTARRLEGGSLKLGDLRGKLALIDFWATWCPPCLAEMPALDAIRESFRDDPRFALVTLSCDGSPDLAAAYLKKNPMGGTHAFAGSLHAGIGSDYLVRAIPATFLVGPDGRILAKNLRGDDLRKAIAAALENKAAFAAAAKAPPRPARFPVVRFPLGPNGEAGAGSPALVVVDHPAKRGGLRLLTESGREVRAIDGYRAWNGVSQSRHLAVDVARGRIYASDSSALRVSALDLSGRKVWEVSGIDADALAVDPVTGRIWCTGGKTLVEGETVVLDGEGIEVDSFPVRGIDIAYDPKTDAFWLAGYALVKLGRDGKELFRKPVEGWCWSSVAIDPGDGSAWFIERAHPDVAQSRNRLWHLDAAGSPLKVWPLGEKHAYDVAFDPKAGIAYVTCLGDSLHRFASDGRDLSPLPIRARNVTVGPTTGLVWAAMEKEVVRIDPDGGAGIRVPIEGSGWECWLVAF